MKIPAWTASSIDAFMTCPYKYYRLKVVKDVKDLPPSDSVLWGRKVHKAFENAVNWGDPLPADLKNWAPIVDQLQAIKGEKLPEYKFSITEDFQPCKWGEAWSRGAADLVILSGDEAIIVDYKTGKRKPSDQLQLYAGFAFATWPNLKKVHTAFIWLKDRKIDRQTYSVEDKHQIWENWIPLVERVVRAYESDQWQKRPSGLCKAWCPCKDCEHCGV
jgi:hypothetical protein